MGAYYNVPLPVSDTGASRSVGKMYDKGLTCGIDAEYRWSRGGWRWGRSMNDTRSTFCAVHGEGELVHGAESNRLPLASERVNIDSRVEDHWSRSEDRKGIVGEESNYFACQVMECL